MGYAITVALVLVAGGIRWVFSPQLGHALPYALFVLPLVLAACFQGHRAALIATVGGFALGSMFAQGPHIILDNARGVIFLLIGLSVTLGVWVVEKSRVQAEQAQRASDDAHRHKDWFIAVLGHELRNPLHGILLGTSVLLKHPATDADGRSMAELIDRQARHMQKLIDDMLDIARMAQGKIQLVCQEVNLQQVLQTCVEQQTAGMASHGHELRVHTPPHGVFVRGDPDRLIQVVANLLTNACKYSPPGSLITVTLSVSSTLAVVEVRDNGLGIPADKLAVIFQPFMQLENAVDRAEGGLGLGLPMVKALVELHKGNVQADNAEPDGGAVFTVRLPLVENRMPTA